MPPHKHPEDEKTKKDEKTKRQKKKVKNNPEEKPPCCHPGDFQAAFSLPLNVFIIPLSVIPEWFYQESEL